MAIPGPRSGLPYFGVFFGAAWGAPRWGIGPKGGVREPGQLPFLLSLEATPGGHSLAVWGPLAIFWSFLRTSGADWLTQQPRDQAPFPRVWGRPWISAALPPRGIGRGQDFPPRGAMHWLDDTPLRALPEARVPAVPEG